MIDLNLAGPGGKMNQIDGMASNRVRRLGDHLLTDRMA